MAHVEIKLVHVEIKMARRYQRFLQRDISKDLQQRLSTNLPKQKKFLVKSQNPMIESRCDVSYWPLRGLLVRDKSARQKQ